MFRKCKFYTNKFALNSYKTLDLITYRYIKEYQRVLKTPEVIQKMNEFSEMNSNLTKWSGKNISTPLDMYSLYNVLMAEWMMNLPLPEWTHSVFPDGQLKDGIIYSYEVSNSNTKLKRLFGGINISH